MLSGEEVKRYSQPIVRKWIHVEDVQKDLGKYISKKILIPIAAGVAVFLVVFIGYF